MMTTGSVQGALEESIILCRKAFGFRGRRYLGSIKHYKHCNSELYSLFKDNISLISELIIYYIKISFYITNKSLYICRSS